MLKLGRKFGQTIVVTCEGKRLVIHVERPKKCGTDVDLAFDDDAWAFTIHRGELQAAIDREEREGQKNSRAAERESGRAASE